MKIRKRLKRRPIAGSEAKAYENIEVSLQIDENLDHLKNILGESMDVKILPVICSSSYFTRFICVRMSSEMSATS
ncbi:hypothetical protein [Fictibacillus sp. FJAT-27399]|uniref:hypothetical protein n=1 Tax=Fictibacillus sp. FJAT-27399 TaxID=1729689 RepID=UPI0007809E60|nr:hypothetical protein [Fictibacillus sp. FJAT-27399]